MATDAAAQPQKRRVRKRIWIPSALLGVLALAALWLWWRGTYADNVERNPASAADGPVTQLLMQKGRTFVRCAIVVPAPPMDVWQVVTDYDAHPKFLRYIAELSSAKLDDGQVRLIGVAHSRLWGSFPFEIDVTHIENPAQGEFTATWAEEDKAGFRVDRGSWSVRPLAGNQSLLVFTKESEVPGYPNFLVRNIMLDRVGAVVQSMRDEVLKRRAGS